MTEDPRGKRGSFQTSYKLLSIFYTRSIYTKIYLCISSGLHFILEIQIDDLRLEFELQ